MDTSLDNGNDTTGDDTLTRHSSKLSLGSSPSILSADEEDADDEDLVCDPTENINNNNNNGNDHRHTTKTTTTSLGIDHKDGGCSEENSCSQGTMTHTDKIMNEKNGGTDGNGDDDIDDLFDGSLPSCTSDLDDINMEHDSASPLSSVPDDFPLSPETQDDSPPPPTHNSTSLSPPPPPTSPMTRRQKQKQLQVATSSSSLPRETGSGKRRTSIQGDTTLSRGNSNKRRRRSKNQGGENQVSDRTAGNSDKGDLYENDGKDLHQTMIKSRRSVSIHGRTIHNKSTAGNNREEQEDDNDDNGDGNDDDDDDDDDHNKVDQMANSSNKQTPLGPTKHHNSAKAPTPPSKSNTSTQQQQQSTGKDGSDNGHQDIDSNNEEKENTPVISNHDNACTTSLLRNDHSGTSSSSTIYTSSLDNSENIPINEEEQQDDQQQHKEAYDALSRIEVEFARLRDKLYQEKMAELNEEAMMIANGTHPSLVTLMTEIEEKKGRRISTAEAWRKYQHANFKRQFEGFEYQANVHFISRKLSMRRKILAETNGKRWRLEDEVGTLHDPSRKHGKLIPDTNALMIRKQGQRNETMGLQDIKDAVGFPRAPQVAGLSTQDIRDDLLLLGLGPSGAH